MTNSPGIEHHAYLPLAWQDANVLTPQQIADWMHDNVIALQAIDAVESHTSQAHERESERASSDHNTVRLEAKVDLLLQLIGKLLLAQQPLPAATEFILGPEVVAWKCAAILTPGLQGVLSLYLAPNLPTPLMLPVEVIGCIDGQAHAKLLHLTEDVQDWLNRTLFRYHRRALQARSQNPH